MNAAEVNLLVADTQTNGGVHLGGDSRLEFLMGDFTPLIPHMQEVVLHVSGVASHQGCPRKWWLLDRDHGKYMVIMPPSALRIGSMVHDAMDYYYYEGLELMEGFNEALRKCKKESQERAVGGVLWQEEKNTIKKDALVAAGMLQNYQSWITSQHGQEYNDDQLRWEAVERTFHLEYEGVKMAGRWDGLVQHRETGFWYLMEHKTTSKLSTMEANTQWDPQPVFYMWAAGQVLDVAPVGIIYTFMQKTKMVDIPLLKNGLPSKAVKSSFSTTYDAYKKVLDKCLEGMPEKQQEEVMDSYVDVLEYLMYEAPPLFQRIMHMVSPQRMEATRDNMIREAVKMAETLRLGPKAPAHQNRMRCPSCEARYVCLAMDSGADWESIAEEQFACRSQTTADV